MDSKRQAASDVGVSLVEVAVAIIVLGIVLIGLFPLVVNSITLAAQNATVAQANRVVSAELDRSRGELLDTDCALTTTKVVERFTATRTVSSCPAPQRLATVTVSVVKTTEPGKTISSATTKVIVRMVESTP
ncbi:MULTISPECIES: hypothetical protein [unclassified Leucobacter]|uniref:type IV pilus modification PilV family protein n=1 Tax=unclassified Leucobacter TaxID=2621730 RepID=UPI00165D3907|nr:MULTISPECIES: hypothetical protein [unclassified Leucobacter]MBC9935577.1 hypothetical protein [Leucobacter sp. cx-87]